MRVVDPVREMSAETDWWSLLDGEVLDCIACGRPVTPEEIGEKLGMSADAAASLVSMLVHDGRVRISSVELAPAGRRA